MAALTGNSVASTYKDLLQVSNSNAGVDATLRTVDDGEGTASALSISSAAIQVDNIKIDGNTITSEDTNGNITLTPNGTGVITASAKITASGGIDIGDDASGSRIFFSSDKYLYEDVDDGEAIKLRLNTDQGNEAFVIEDQSGVAKFSFNVDGANKDSWLNAGNVGIGTTSPDKLLSLEKSSYGTGGAGFALYNPQNGSSARGSTQQWQINDGVSANVPAVYLQGFKTSNTSGGIFTISTSVGGTAGSWATPTERLRIDSSGNVGIGTTAPGQLLDVNSGGGNMIADGYDTHSLAVYKENIEDASGYLDKVLACPAQKWNRKPFVSANEIKEAVLEEFGEDVLIEEAVEAQDAVYETIVVQEAVEEELWAEGDDLPEDIEIGDVKTEAQEEETEEQLVSEAIEAKDAVYEKQYSVWDELFPEDNSHRQKALYNMPDGDLKTWIDDWCEAKRVEMRPENKWQKKRLGLVADAELTAEHLPEVVSINDDGEPTGIDTMTYIGILHNAVQELSAKVEALENA